MENYNYFNLESDIYGFFDSIDVLLKYQSNDKL